MSLKLATRGLTKVHPARGQLVRHAWALKQPATLADTLAGNRRKRQSDGQGHTCTAAQLAFEGRVFALTERRPDTLGVNVSNQLLHQVRYSHRTEQAGNHLRITWKHRGWSRDDRMQIELRQVQGTCIAALQGEVDLSNSPQARTLILDCLNRGQSLLVDLSGVDYIDSSGIAVLVEGFRLASDSQLTFGLLAVSEATLRVLQLARLDKVFLIFADMDAYLASR